ncbi:M10 family metallopeptidase C-terminal domain-containing protein [Sphingomonas colocasiae]|uniref:M10 family metallopeptidase C-terminal domain-containing protein n=1 Tax=Sphingomonas colocasiae TaxID=1848973 RepID=A0ABS7PWZ0_9SPHN|nr:M10 family metallopeptidase C-terminal domain-containing protein [Sphingomonas colocasiae]MBY8825879.1 M10 family metallopeptidase C-terminal domain-containing protein [Sphingomonas colocasiae]
MSTTAENFTPATDNPFILALAAGVRYNNAGPVTYYIAPSDHDNNGVNDWDQDGAGDGLRAAVASWASVIDLDFTEVFSASEANWVERVLTPYSFGATAYHYYPSSFVGVYGGGYDLLPNSDPGDSRVGGEYFRILLHELGHGLGLDHTHDGGSGDVYFPGASGPQDRGSFDLNTDAYSVMSYVGDHQSRFGLSYSVEWGYIGGPMAFDIAAAQAIYGANMATGAGDDIYDLPATNGIGTYFWCIWDAGGNDTVRYQGAAASVIDLRAATLQVAPGGGGYFSQATGIIGGFSIANGVVIENAVGGSGDDLITGNQAGNTIDGGDGADTIIGGAGADTLRGGNGADVFLFQGAGDSTQAAPDRIVDFTPGVDTIDLRLTGATGFSVSAEGGATRLNATTANGVLSILVDGSFTLEQLLPGAIAATVDGNGGNPVAGTAGADIVFGMAGADSIQGGDGGDFIVGGEGSDSLEGGAGADTIHGGNGMDDLFDMNGHDFISGGDGDDLLFGELGNDTLLGGAGDDGLFGGYGDDRLDPGSGKATVDGGAGTDTLALTDWAPDSHEAWLVRTDQYHGEILRNGVSLIEFTSIERFDLVMGNGNDFFVGTLEGDSTVRAGAGNDLLYGIFGKDHFMGEAGNDTLDGGSGDDWLEGGDGDDVLVGGAGNDSIDGGAGADRAEFTDVLADCVISFDGDVCVVETKNQGVDRLANVETAVFAGVAKTMAELRTLAVDRTAPALATISPSDAAVGVVVNANIVAQFDEAIARGAGTVVLRRDDGTMVETFDIATSGRILVSGSMLVVDPTQELAAGTRYTVSIAAGAIRDLSGNDYAGLTGYDFTTEAAVRSSRLIAPGKFVGSWGGGDSDIFGTRAGFQEITILDRPGAVALDGSFSGGGDLVRLHGNAADYVVSVGGSNAILSDGDTEIAIPVGTVGTALLFDDGLRTLVYADGAVRVGGQVIGSALSLLSAAAESGPAPTGSDPNMLGRVVIGAGESVSVSGNVEIFGSRGQETIEILGGRANLDGSFSAGGDIIIVNEAATSFTARVAGSLAVLVSDDIELLVPIGIVGATLRFADGDRILIYDGAVKVGDQAIGSTPIHLLADGFA